MPRDPRHPPVPPHPFPPARTVTVPGRGEFFLRDSGLGDDGDAPPVLLLHGWFVSADLNWGGAYGALVDAGYRVLAIDHRGHGRGLRSMAPFRLTDCADDAAAVLRAIDVGPATVVGYSMGGTIAQLLARDHRELVSGLVLSGTCQHFQDPATARAWRWMGAVGLALGIAPRTFYRLGFRRQGRRPGPDTAWLLGELMRHESRDVAEAGRELGRFDSRPWLRSVDVPATMVLTANDTAVSPAKQRELAEAVDAQIFEVGLDHLEITVHTDAFNAALVSAIAALGDRSAVAG